MIEHICFIGLGSNLGESCDMLKLAIEDLGGLPGTRVLKSSSLYCSAPVGYLDQPDFVNAVAKIATTLTPGRLLSALLDIERCHGRERTFCNAPRTLDLDLLLYDDARIDEPDLTVPHPQMHLRAFVLLPLLEIEPDCEIPVIGSARLALTGCAGQILKKLAD